MGCEKTFSIISWCVHKHATSVQWNVFSPANYLPGSGRAPPSKVNKPQQGKKKGGTILEKVLNGHGTVLRALQEINSKQVRQI